MLPPAALADRKVKMVSSCSLRANRQNNMHIKNRLSVGNQNTNEEEFKRKIVLIYLNFTSSILKIVT